MKFKDYMKVRGNNGISKIECDIFGIKNTKGWVKRYADLELTQNQINRAVTALLSSKHTSARAIGNIQSLQKQDYVEWEGKYLYLMKNEVGNLKIGISEDPIKRSRAITNAGGTLTQCIAYWKVSDYTRDVESFLLKRWKNHKTYGEWFKAETFTLQDIENAMKCQYERLFYNPQWDVGEI